MAIIPLLLKALLDYVPTADELDVGACYIVDGTLLPCWSWRAHPELYNKQINKIRYVIEQVIANFKTWRIMRTGYRRPRATFPATISPPRSAADTT